jgi:hypothetical protein
VHAYMIKNGVIRKGGLKSKKMEEEKETVIDRV